MIDYLKITVPLAHGKAWQNKIAYDTRQDEHQFIGHIGNIKIIQNIDQVYLMGSIAKFFKGENITPLTRKQVKQALELLQERTDIELDTGVLCSVEFGTSIMVKNPISIYLQCFNYVPRYTRNECGKYGIETIWYGTPTGSIKFIAYDKINEMRHKTTIPVLFRGSNVMRLEYKIMNRQGIKHSFNKDLKPFDLAESETYRKLASLFYDFYTSIEKTGRHVFVDKTKNITPAQLDKLAAEQYRQSFPKEYALFLQAAKSMGTIDDTSIKRIKQANKKTGKDYSVSLPNTHIAELDEKVRQWALGGA